MTNWSWHDAGDQSIHRRRPGHLRHRGQRVGAARISPRPPQALEEGLFAWRHGNMVVESFVVQKDVAPDTMKVARRVPEAPPAPIAPTPTAAMTSLTSPAPVVAEPAVVLAPTHAPSQQQTI